MPKDIELLLFFSFLIFNGAGCCSLRQPQQQSDVVVVVYTRAMASSLKNVEQIGHSGCWTDRVA
jgi:hypothetical protein